ncbi:MAG: DMT family transporter [Rhodospirillales bacterium]|nr:DMT family transporter [Rhodospirillales bacterium]HJO72619.1 DMT family transporter [Rhodospirillales bacterium]
MSPIALLPEMSTGRHGILWILLSAAMFAGMDASAKELALSYPLPQVVWARYPASVVLVLAVVLARRRVSEVIVTRRLGLQVLRGGLVVATLSFQFTAIHFIPLADATALLFTAPILVTALSSPVLGEPVRRELWVGVVLGFVGALVIIRPGLGVMQVAALLPLGAAFMLASYQIAGRILSRTDQALTTFAYTIWVGAIGMSLVVPFYWKTPDFTGWMLMAALGLFAGFGQFAVIKAFEAAPAATVTPFIYSGLLWVTLLGYTVFGDLPDLWTILGALLILSSGFCVLDREHARRGSAGADGHG